MDSKEVKLTEKMYYVAKCIADLPADMRVHPDNVRAESTYSLELQGMVVALAATLWGKNRKTIRFPKTWWDAFKLRWFPKWALEKWPPVITKVKYDEVLPELHIKGERSSIIQIKQDVSYNWDTKDQDEVE